jgi:hypothetical protein
MLLLLLLMLPWCHLIWFVWLIIITDQVTHISRRLALHAAI